MPEIFASLGSNENREHNIRSAVAILEKIHGLLKLSPVYQNPAVGFAGEDFLNMVVGFESDQTPVEIQDQFHQIEAEHGRQRGGERFAPRSLDIDLILYGDRVSEQPLLPRPDILQYAFVLKPLADLVPEYVHPVTQETYASLWQNYQGQQALSPVIGLL